MQLADLQQLYDYDLWATNRLLDAAEKLEGEAARSFIEAKGHGIGSARDLVVHIADAQTYWLTRIQGQDASMPNRERFSSVSEIRDHCTRANRAVVAWLESVGDDGLAADWEFSFRPGAPSQRVPTSGLWHHVALHGVHHRAEASELLTAAGSPPASMDLLGFIRQPV